VGPGRACPPLPSPSPTRPRFLRHARLARCKQFSSSSCSPIRQLAFASGSCRIVSAAPRAVFRPARPSLSHQSPSRGALRLSLPSPSHVCALIWLSTCGSADDGTAGRAHALETPSAMTQTSRAPSRRSFRRRRSVFFCITFLSICLHSAQDTASGTHPPLHALLSLPPTVTLRSRLPRRERGCTSPLAQTSGSAVGARRRVVPPPDGMACAADILAEVDALADALSSERNFCLSV
jgi:hypothetical protein